MDQRQVQKLIDKNLLEFKDKNFGFKSRIVHDKPSDPNTLGSFNWQISITGSKGANAALASLISALVSTGLIIDNTS